MKLLCKPVSSAYNEEHAENASAIESKEMGNKIEVVLVIICTKIPLKVRCETAKLHQ